MRRKWIVTTVGLVALVLLAACGGDDEATPEPPPAPAESVPATTAGTEDPAAEASFEVQLEEQNGSGQTGIATVTPSAEGVGVTVEIASADVAQFALVARGTCERLGEPFANILPSGEQELTGGTKSGRFEEAALVNLADGAPATLGDLQADDFAVLVLDAAYRGGVIEEIPADVLVFQGPDPAGPYGETPFPIAACGDLPPSG